MYQVTVKKHFDTAHYLRGYQGKCEQLHGHRYQVAVQLKADKLNNIGLVYDFKDLKRKLKSVIKRFDHCCLNEVEPFDKINPSAENIAKTIFEELDNEIGGSLLASVEVWESPDCSVKYKP